MCAVFGLGLTFSHHHSSSCLSSHLQQLQVLPLPPPVNNSPVKARCQQATIIFLDGLPALQIF